MPARSPAITPSVVIVGAHHTSSWPVQSVGGRYRVEVLQSVEELRPRHGAASGILLNLLDARDRSGNEIVTALRAAGIALPVVAVATLQPRDCHMLVELAAAGLRFGVVLPDGNRSAPISDRIMWLQQIPSPMSQLIACFASQAPSRTHAIVVAGVIVGLRRTSVACLATITGVPQRTVRQRLQLAGLPSPQRYLGWVLALHTAWRIERQEVSYQAAATLAGADTVRALSAYLRSHVRRSIRGIEDLGFDRLLEWCHSQRSRAPAEIDMGDCGSQTSNAAESSAITNPAD